MMRMPVIATLLPMFVFAACSTSPPSSLYLVEPLAAGARFDVDPDTVVVIGPVHLPERLNRREIVSHRQLYRLAAPRLEQWGEPLEQNIARAVAENLSELAAAGIYLPYTSAAQGAADYSTRLVIHEFGDSPRDGVVLDVSWALVDDAGAQPAYVNSRYTESAADDSTLAMVAAMSRLLEEFSADVAAALAATSAAAD